MILENATLDTFLEKLGAYQRIEYGELGSEDFLDVIHADLERITSKKINKNNILFQVRIWAYLHDMIMNAEMWGKRPIATTGLYSQNAVVFSVSDQGDEFHMFQLLQESLSGYRISSRINNQGGIGLLCMHNGYGQPSHPNLVCQDTVNDRTRVNMFYPFETTTQVVYAGYDWEQKNPIFQKFFQDQ